MRLRFACCSAKHHPEHGHKYRDLILDRLKFIKNNREDTFKLISAELIELLKNNGIHAKITGREKTPFSIWRKLQKKRVSLEQISDIILSLIHI